MIYGSVCSGIEAATLAWEPLGWKPAFFSEIDKAPCQVLKHRWPNVKLFGDFRDITKKDIGKNESIDLLVGGTPCQDFSVAGLREGLAGDRGNLTIEFLRLADRLRPKWIVWENVCGVLSIDKGRAFGTFLGLLGEFGYGFAYRVFDAQFFGVPQRRQRVFVIGHFGNWRPPAAVLFDSESLSGNPAPRRETRQKATCDVRSGVAGTIGSHKSGGWGAGGDLDTCGAIIPEIAHTLRGEGCDASEDGTGRGIPLVSPALKARDYKGPSSDGDGDGAPLITFDCRGTQVQNSTDNVSPTLRSMNNANSHINGGGHVAVAFAQNQVGEVRVNEISNTLGTNSNASGRNAPLASTANAVRRLTPRECERLQGMPDDHTLIPVGKKMMSDSARYKMIGNSMAVPVMARIGYNIETVRKLMESANDREKAI